MYFLKNDNNQPQFKIEQAAFVTRLTCFAFHQQTLFFHGAIIGFEERDHRRGGCGQDMECLAEHSIDNYSERHCNPSGKFLGIGCATTYLWGKGFGAWATALDEDEVPAESACRMWNLAKRLMTENFSNSWQSTLTSKIDDTLSNLHHHIRFIKTWCNCFAKYIFLFLSTSVNEKEKNTWVGAIVFF